MSSGRSGASSLTTRPQASGSRPELRSSKVEERLASPKPAAAREPLGADSPQKQIARPSAGSAASSPQSASARPPSQDARKGGSSARRPSQSASARLPSQDARKGAAEGFARRADNELAQKRDARPASGSTRGRSPTSTGGSVAAAKLLSARASNSGASKGPASSWSNNASNSGATTVRQSPERPNGGTVGRQSKEAAPATPLSVNPQHKDLIFEKGMRVLAQWQGQWYPAMVVSFRDGEDKPWTVQCDADRRGEYAEVSNLTYEFVKGSRVMAEWQGKWLSGSIAEVPAGSVQLFQVQCDCDAAGVVTPILSGVCLKPEEHRFAKGSRVQVEWEGTWYPGTIITVSDKGLQEWQVQCDADPAGQVTPIASRYQIKPDTATIRHKRSV